MSHRILLVGESWTSTASHIKGWDRFSSVTHHRGADEFIARVGNDDCVFDYMLCHEAAERFPSEPEELDAYDTIVLSDIGSNTLLLPEAVWIHSRRIPNRLKAIRDYVKRGGGLIMVGGYYSFQGINGGARYSGTPVEEVLPVTIHRYDDRREMPEGISPLMPAGAAKHPVLKGVPGDMPYILGINEVVAKPEATTLLALPDDEGGHPVLVVSEHGNGRAAAWTTDIGPHWLPVEFLRWESFAQLWRNLLAWTSGGSKDVG